MILVVLYIEQNTHSIMLLSYLKLDTSKSYNTEKKVSNSWR